MQHKFLRFASYYTDSLCLPIAIIMILLSHTFLWIFFTYLSYFCALPFSHTIFPILSSGSRHTEHCTVKITVIIRFINLQTVFAMYLISLINPLRYLDDLLPPRDSTCNLDLTLCFMFVRYLALNLLSRIRLFNLTYLTSFYVYHSC